MLSIIYYAKYEVITMNFSQISKLYPNAYLSTKKPISNTVYFWKFKNKWLIIAKSDLNPNEATLLSLLLQNNQNHLSSNPWVQFLQNAGKEPSFSGKIRFLFFQVDTNPNNISLWLKVLKNMFNTKILADFAIKQNQYCIVENVDSTSYSSKEFVGVLQTIDTDAESNTKLFIGRCWNHDDNIITYYAEEKKIFQSCVDQVISTVFTLQDVVLSYFAKSKLQKSNIILFYRKQIYHDKQLPNIIKALYQNQGNISLTAKKLYLHRNTLLYHIEKANQNLGLDLKQIDNLLLAYMALL